MSSINGEAKITPILETCIICMENIQSINPQILISNNCSCKIYGHESCARSYILINDKCPTCRKIINISKFYNDILRLQGESKESAPISSNTTTPVIIIDSQVSNCECIDFKCQVKNENNIYHYCCCECRRLTFCGDIGCIVYTIYKFFTNYIFSYAIFKNIIRCFKRILITPLMYIIPKLITIIIVNFSQKDILGEKYENEKAELIAQNLDTQFLTDNYNYEIKYLNETIIASVLCQTIIFLIGTAFFIRSYDISLTLSIKYVYINVFIGHSFCILTCLLAQNTTLGGDLNIIDAFGSLTLTLLSWWILFCVNHNRLCFSCCDTRNCNNQYTEGNECTPECTPVCYFDDGRRLCLDIWCPCCCCFTSC